MIHMVTSDVPGRLGEAIAVSTNRDGFLIQAGHEWDGASLTFGYSVRVALSQENATDLMSALYRQGVRIPDSVLRG